MIVIDTNYLHCIHFFFTFFVLIFDYFCVRYRGLYGGIGIHLMRSVPNAAVMFVTFEVASKWLLKKQLEQNEKDNNKINNVSEFGITKNPRSGLAFAAPFMRVNSLPSHISKI